LAARAARLLDRFGFSWTIAVVPRTARKQGLDFLGFPWILSFESRLFNGLRGIKRGKYFHALLEAFKAVGDADLQCWHADGQGLTWGKLSLDSDFQQ
jgi:hypothetical protein